MKARMTAREYAALRGLHEDTVGRWLANAAKPEADRNANLPPIKARRIGNRWEIDVAATDQLQSLKCGNPVERELAGVRP